METSDILIHVNEFIEDGKRLGVQEAFGLEEALRQAEGVVSWRFSPGHNHLVFVAYDTDSTSALAILGQVRERGYGAQIVGI
jgi:hypothetical protein